MGHVLGFSHPDTVAASLRDDVKGSGNVAGVNSYSSLLASGQRLSAANGCLRPWDEVLPGTPPGDPTVPSVGPAASLVRPSIMKALTQHNPRVCLTDDDLEGLNVLYPDCSHSISVPVCDKVAYNIGWVRLGVWVLTPILVALLLMLCMFGFTSHQQNKRLDHQVKLRMMRSADLLVVKKEKDEVEELHKNASMALKKQKATEEKRVEKEARRRSVMMFEELKKEMAISPGGTAIVPIPASQGGGPSSARSSSSSRHSEVPVVNLPEGLGEIPAAEWEEKVKRASLKPEHQYEPGTMGYRAEQLAEAIDGVASFVKRRSSAGGASGLLRRASSIMGGDESADHTNREALRRARKANGRPTLGGAKAKSKANTKHVTIEGGDRAASPPQGRESSFDAV